MPQGPQGQRDREQFSMRATLDEFARPLLSLSPIFRLPLAAFLIFVAIGLPLIPERFRLIHEGCQAVLYGLLAVWLIAIIRKRNAKRT
jgi:hypothetical protein